MLKNEFRFLNIASDYIDASFKIDGKAFDFSRTYCFARDDGLIISKDTGLKYKPLRI